MKKTLIAAALGLFSLNSQAHLIQGDWLSEGDGLSILDTYSGVEWLKLTETKGMSVPDVLANDKYSGWSVANYYNVEKLFKNNISYNKENIPLEERHYSSVDDEDRYFLSGRNTEGWTNSLISLLGITKTTSSYSGAFLDRTSYGLIAGVGLARVSLTEKTYSNSGRYEEEFVYSVDRNGSYDENIKLPYSGVFLFNTGGVTVSSLSTPNYNVALNDVPLENASFALLPFLMLAFRKRKSV